MLSGSLLHSGGNGGCSLASRASLARLPRVNVPHAPRGARPPRPITQEGPAPPTERSGPSRTNERRAPAAGRSGLPRRCPAGLRSAARPAIPPVRPSALVFPTPPFPSSGRARGCKVALLRGRTGIPPSTERSGLFTGLTSAAGGNPRLQLLLTSPRRDSTSPPRPVPAHHPARGPASGSSSKPRPRPSPAPPPPPGADVEGGASPTGA